MGNTLRSGQFGTFFGHIRRVAGNNDIHHLTSNVILEEFFSNPYSLDILDEIQNVTLTEDFLEDYTESLLTFTEPTYFDKYSFTCEEQFDTNTLVKAPEEFQIYVKNLNEKFLKVFDSVCHKNNSLDLTVAVYLINNVVEEQEDVLPLKAPEAAT
ncbi:hypothetical protein FF38_01652 [Lucilia cuprina]|uniref:Uncharacterized protein n=1 Tax=Lucilia cuprina TaxID=7375 RepID=A0A0L0BX49_LUCCU|nr:hypothetical protein FF38_01652 [Lucilia cuprina]